MRVNIGSTGISPNVERSICYPAPDKSRIRAEGKLNTFESSWEALTRHWKTLIKEPSKAQEMIKNAVLRMV